MTISIQISRFGDHSVLIDWENSINPKINNEILAYNHHLLSRFCNDIIETVTTYCSMAVYLKPEVAINDFIQRLKVDSEIPIAKTSAPKKCIIIPVCYRAPHALDLEAVARQLGVDISEIIQLHTQPLYTVHFIGFLPGFPYLGGLNPRLYCKRLAKPRSLVTAGDVGIGGMQTGIYSVDSPGGWHIIGKTPLPLFDVSKKQPSLLSTGDRVKFKAISTAQFQLHQLQVATNTFTLEQEVLYD